MCWNVNLVCDCLDGLEERNVQGVHGVVRECEKTVVLFDGCIGVDLPVVASWDNTHRVRLLRDEKLYAVVDGERFLVKLNSLDIHLRTPFKASHLSALSQKTVVLIGVGSMGGFIALMLARAGVESFVLCDPDRVEVCNVSRHEASLFDVGRFKVDVIAEHIRLINSVARVRTVAGDLFAQPLDDVAKVFSEASLVVATTDKRSVQLMVNNVALQTGTFTVFAGCYEEARGGEVFCLFPGTDTPCYSCLRGGIPEPKKGPIDYSLAKSAEDYRGEPGLYASVSFVSSVAVEACLSILLSDTGAELENLFSPECQYWLVGGALAEGFMGFRKPFEIYHQPLKGPRKLCSACMNHRGTEEEVED
jgi:molybdopterin/thiamine biosynthesis adenylyltransferase